MSSHPPSRHQLCTSRIPPLAFWNEIYTYILYEAIKTASPNLNYIKYLFCDKIVLFYFILLYVCLSLCAFIHFHFTFSRQKRKILHFFDINLLKSWCWNISFFSSLPHVEYVLPARLWVTEFSFELKLANAFEIASMSGILFLPNRLWRLNRVYLILCDIGLSPGPGYCSLIRHYGVILPSQDRMAIKVESYRWPHDNMHSCHVLQFVSNHP